MTRKRRGPAFDPGDPLLPVAGQGVLSGVRRSHRSAWRAAVLVGVHVVIVLHATHFLIAGATLSPVEPSEAMYTLELGQVNAGFIFFLVALLSTAIFGRFFCGWGCHIVALQDLCGWIMKRLGIRPRPFRSRLLLLAPMVLALYMFVWPTVRRLVLPSAAAEFPGFTNHLVTSGFWDTFPGPLFAVLTFLTCGFAAVYVLGAKGFCTYGCPYGAFFGVLDRVAPGQILVTDDCEQCGHCTATCTSNVRVHDEVRQFGRVVDPGCMKCMDCVSVCPKNALYFGFAKPSWLSRSMKREPRPKARFGSLPWPEEVLVAALCLLGTLAFRGLYDGPPLLMSLGLGGITALVALKAWRLVGAGTVRLQNLDLKLGGKIQTAGLVFAILTLGWLAFTAHSGFVQWHRFRGRVALEATQATREEVLRGDYRARNYSAGPANRAYRHFAAAERWGLAPVLEVKLGLVWTHLLRDEFDPAESRLREAIALAPSRGDLRDDHVDLLLGRGRDGEAVNALLSKIDGSTGRPRDTCRVAALLAAAEDYPEAIRHYTTCTAEFPDSFEARYNLGGLLRRSEREQEALIHLQAAVRLNPADFDVHVELGLAYMALGEGAAARDALAQAVALKPESPEARFHLRGLIQRLDDELSR